MSIDNRDEFCSCRNCHVSRKEKDKIKRFYRKFIGIKLETLTNRTKYYKSVLWSYLNNNI